MKRRSTIKITALGAIAASLSLRLQTRLDSWVERFGARLTRGESTMKLELAIAPDELFESLQALDQITDGPIHCNGSEARGEIGGESFLLRIA